MALPDPLSLLEEEMKHLSIKEEEEIKTPLKDEVAGVTDSLEIRILKFFIKEHVFEQEFDGKSIRNRTICLRNKSTSFKMQK